MSRTLEETVRSLFRSSEELELLLEAEAAPLDSDDSGSEDGPPGSYSSGATLTERSGDRKRLVAIVSHVDPYGDEQGW